MGDTSAQRVQSVVLPVSRRRIWRNEKRRRRYLAQHHRRMLRGQTLVIFALSFTVLLALAGLTVDAGRAYDMYGRMQRAAEAGALAGVLYMPDFYSQPTPAGVGVSPESAVSRASEEVFKNGFGTVLANNVGGCPPPGSSEVTICQVTGKTDDLKVTITETLDVVLLSGLGVQPITLTTSAQAEYLPTVQLGSRLNYFGDQVECYNTPSSPNITQTHHCNRGGSGGQLQNFLATMNGPQTLKEYGDPMVYCEEGPTSATAAEGSGQPYTTYNGIGTNHQQWTPATRAGVQSHCGPPGGSNSGNTDQQLSGFDGPATDGTAHPGAYNYEIVVPSGITTASVWVYNPSFIPNCAQLGGSCSLTDPSGDGNTLLDVLDPYGTDPFGAGVTFSNQHADAPPLYFTMTYTLYHVQTLYDRTADVQLRSEVFPPYDGFSADMGTHGCPSPSGVHQYAYDPYYAGAATPNSYYNSGSIQSGKGCVDLSTNSIYPTSVWASNPNVGPPCYMLWCQITTSNLSAGVYRLAVEATGLNVPVGSGPSYHSSSVNGSGQHSYALKVCTNATTTPISCANGASGSNPGVTIFGWNNMELDVTSPLSAATPNANNPTTTCATSPIGNDYTCVDLGCIPTPYAGRTVQVGLYDPGDGNGNIFVGVVPPSGVSQSTVQYTQPSWITTATTTIDGDKVVQAGHGSYNELNGLWLNAQLSLPANYTGNCLTGASGTGWWQLIYATNNNAQPFDWLNVQFSLVGSPVHLVS